MTGSAKPQAAVLDIGKTNLKLVLVDPEGHCTASISRVHDFLLDEPYPAIDIDAIIGWFLGGLAELAGCHRIGALVDEAGPVLAMMDYEAATPPRIDALYALEGLGHHGLIVLAETFERALWRAGPRHRHRHS